MKHSDFKLNETFYLNHVYGSSSYRVTDIGKRTIIAIELTQTDLRNYNGPPYSIPEFVFDENDLESCSLLPE